MNIQTSLLYNQAFHVVG